MKMNTKNKRTILLFLPIFIVVAGPSIIQPFVLIEELGCKKTYMDTQTGNTRYQYYYCGVKFREIIERSRFSEYLDKYHISHNVPDWKYVNSNGILLTQFCSLGKDSILVSLFYEISTIIEVMEQNNTPSGEITAFINMSLQEIQKGNYEQLEKSWEQYLND